MPHASSCKLEEIEKKCQVNENNWYFQEKKIFQGRVKANVLLMEKKKTPGWKWELTAMFSIEI